MENQNLYNPEGFIKLGQIFLDRLIVRKRVALWQDYKTASEDMLLEFKNKESDAKYEAIEGIFKVLEENTYLENWYNKL